MRLKTGFLIVLIIAAACACALADVSIDDSNFPDANFRDFVSRFENADANGDQKADELDLLLLVHFFSGDHVELE